MPLVEAQGSAAQAKLQRRSDRRTNRHGLEPERRAQSCSTALCCARGRPRASKQGPATFLLDRVAEDIADRLQAVTRRFADAADIWTPGELLRKPLGRPLRVDHPHRP